MREYSKSQIEMLKKEIEYYTLKIEKAKLDKESVSNKTIASDNYYDREIFYSEYHLFMAQAELNRLENYGKSKILR